MQTTSFRLYARCLQGTLSVSVVAYALAAVWIQPDLPAGFGLVGPALTLGTLLAAALTLRSRTRRPPRFALTFILAAMVLLPAPGALLVALPALVLAQGGGIAGPHSRGLPWFAAAGVATAIGQFAVSTWHGPIEVEGLGALAALAAGFVILQALTWAMSFALGEDAELHGDVRIAFVAETLNVPLAWLLAGGIATDNVPVAIAVGVVALVLGEVFGRWQRSATELRESRDALESRLGELHTLHAIGQELLSTLELAPLFATIDRECRKAFDADLCQIALRNNETGELESVYRRVCGDDPDTRELPLRVGLPCRVAERRRGLFVRDMRLMPGIGRDHSERNLLSAMAVPLRVGQRVTGVLMVGSNRPEAYDDHRLSVLDTVAQQVKV